MSIRNHTICQLLPVSNIEWRMTVFLWACWQLWVIKEGHVCINMTEILSWKQIRLKWELSESLSAGKFICVCLASVQSDGFLKDNNNAAQRLLDGVKYISQSVSELSVKPAKAVTSWLTDQIAPAYWKPNSLILVCNSKAGFEKKNYSIVERKRLRKLYGFIASVTLCSMQKCHKCAEEFQPNDTKHHCRACGEGFCDSCSSKTRPVPERGWGLAPVRVCDACFHNREISTGKSSPASVLMVYWTRCFTAGECLILVYANVSPVPELLDAALEEEGGTLIARKVGEAVQNTLGAVVGAIDIPLGEN